MIEDFFHLLPVSKTPMVHLELRISPQICKKIWNGPYGILRGLGETDSWKNQKSKISWHCLFKLHGTNVILRGLGKLIHEKNLKSEISWHCPFKFKIVFIFCRELKSDFQTVEEKLRSAVESLPEVNKHFNKFSYFQLTVNKKFLSFWQFMHEFFQLQIESNLNVLLNVILRFNFSSSFKMNSFSLGKSSMNWA